MIIALFSDIERASSSAWRGPQSMAAGAASLSDSSISSTSSSISSSSAGGATSTSASASCPRARPQRALDAGDEVAQHFLADEQAALQLGDRRRRRLEQDDVVRAFTMVVDGIGQSAAAPRGLLDDLAAAGRDGPGGSLERPLDLVVRQIGTQHEHEFVSAHAPVSPSHGYAPMRERQRRSVGAERTDAFYQGPPASDVAGAAGLCDGDSAAPPSPSRAWCQYQSYVCGGPPRAYAGGDPRGGQDCSRV